MDVFINAALWISGAATVGAFLTSTWKGVAMVAVMYAAALGFVLVGVFT